MYLLPFAYPNWKLTQPCVIFMNFESLSSSIWFSMQNDHIEIVSKCTLLDFETKGCGHIVMFELFLTSRNFETSAI